MFIHDINCGWFDHGFIKNNFFVDDEKLLGEVKAINISDLYIDTSKGLDITDDENKSPEVKEENEIKEKIENEIKDLINKPKEIDLEKEKTKAKKLFQDAKQISKNLFSDIKFGKQIELEKISPIVDGLISSIFSTGDALLPLVNLRKHDEYTFQHSVSVCLLMIAFSRELNLSIEVTKEIATGSLLHDIGKAKIPDEILNKPAKLTEAEFLKMKSHVVQSIIILQNTPGITQIMLDVAGQHHEKFDGSGYPNKLSGNNISLYGLMSSIVDVYDALTADRVYHKGMCPTDALKKLVEWSGTNFEPSLVQSFIKAIGIYPTGSLVQLSSNKLAVVFEQNKIVMTKPKVKVIYHTKGYYLEPYILDLSNPSCKEKIISAENYNKWEIKKENWI